MIGLLSTSLLMGALVADDPGEVAWMGSAHHLKTQAEACEATQEGKACETTEEKPPMECGYNAPVLTTSHRNANLYATLSFIYWRASADYLTYGYLNNSFSSDPDSVDNFILKGKALEPDFKYKPGFKVGLGYKLHRDRWDLYAEYTRFHQTTHTFKRVAPGGQNLVPAWLTFVEAAFIGEEFQSCSSNWTTNFDILDLELGRSYFCGRHFTLRPSVGLRALWLNQKYNLTYVTLLMENIAKSDNKSDSFGIGPRFALDGRWNFYDGLRIVGDVGLSLLNVWDRASSHHHVPLFETFGLTTDETYANKEHLSTLKPILDLSLGLGWGRSFNRDRCAIDLQLTYDYAYFWDQGSIQIGHPPLVVPGGPFQVVVGDASSGSGNLSLQGLTATVRFDF